MKLAHQMLTGVTKLNSKECFLAKNLKIIALKK